MRAILITKENSLKLSDQLNSVRSKGLVAESLTQMFVTDWPDNSSKWGIFTLPVFYETFRSIYQETIIQHPEKLDEWFTVVLKGP